MDATDIVKPPALIYYACLPNVERDCRCTPEDVAAGRDCGIVVTKPKRKR